MIKYSHLAVPVANLKDFQRKRLIYQLGATPLTLPGFNGKPMTWTQALAGWRGFLDRKHSDGTVVTYFPIVSQLVSSLDCLIDPGQLPEALSPEALHEYINVATSLSRRTIRHSALKSFFEWVGNAGYIQSNPAANLVPMWKDLTRAQVVSTAYPPMEVEEFKKLTERSPNWSVFYAVSLQLGYAYGLRISDCARLQWDDLLATDELSIKTMKAGKLVILPLYHPLLGGEWIRPTIELIRERQDRFGLTSRYVFLPQAKRVMAKGASKLSENFARYARAAGVRKTFHCLRSAVITRCFVGGIPLKDIGRLVGHSDLETTAGYVGTSIPAKDISM